MVQLRSNHLPIVPHSPILHMCSSLMGALSYILFLHAMYTSPSLPVHVVTVSSSYLSPHPSSFPVVSHTSSCLPVAMEMMTVAQYPLDGEGHDDHLAHPASADEDGYTFLSSPPQ